MVISTPRLCHDVAFQPPEKTKPHVIACTPVVAATAIPSYLAAQETKAAEVDAEIDAELIEVLNQIDSGVPKKKPQRVGDIEIGAHVLIPKGKKIEKSVVVGGGKETLIATIAKSDGFIASEREMQKVGIKNGKEVEDVKKQVERVAEGKGWRLDVVQTPRGKELRGVIEAADDAKKGKSTGGENAADEKQVDMDKKEIEDAIMKLAKQHGEKIAKEIAARKKEIQGLEEEEGQGGQKESSEGSEESYKEEL
jgi:protein OS-9